MRKDLNQILQGFIKTAGRQIITGIVQLIIIMIISRTYGPAGSGSYTIITLLPITLTNLLNMGITASNVYFIGSKKYKVEIVISNLYKIACALSIIGLLIGFLLITFASDNLFPNVDVWLLYIALIVFPLTLLNSFFNSIFQAIQNFKIFNIILIIQPLSMLLLVSFLTLIDENEIIYLISSLIISSLLSLCVSFFHILQIKNDEKEITRDGYIKDSLKYGIKAHLSNIVAFLNNKADIYFVNMLLNPTSVGFYIISVQLSEKIWIVSQALSTVLLPKLSELSDEENTKKEIVLALSKIVFYITIFLSTFVAIISKPVIILLFGEEFSPAIEPLLYLLPGVVFMTVARVLANDLASRGRPELNMYTSIIIVIVNIIGNIILIPLYGISGAAISTSIAYVLNCILRCLMYRYYTKVKISDLFIINRSDAFKLFNLFKVKFGHVKN
ncbi:lipopolysaccharide biosynthesis protein [Photobacterium profundum]|uniref:Uncharacterized protein n=1 Tax=Photobacterium profundum (strain SS9) TaxID=298386 RepID=Q6LNR4_PHOPR|nr:oligosaccharide flippase family protein [Photobacterium profundum]CAG21062.1 hypothetical protein PBPRA2684 [Photobacterium profundum SS9]